VKEVPNEESSADSQKDGDSTLRHKAQILNYANQDLPSAGGLKVEEDTFVTEDSTDYRVQDFILKLF
jgi:hypothetical protein